jgi:hypothetical protein
MKQFSFKFLRFILLFIFMSSCNKDIKDGLTSLVNVTGESAGKICPSGGYKIETGIDINSNAVLDSGEVQNSEYICNGNNGFISLVKVTGELSGENCSSGGYKVETGIDINSNAVLDSSEVQNLEYICNGNNGFISLINVKAEPVGENCSSGGYKVETGLDINNNAVLDPNEVQVSDYICNGNEGSISLIKVTIEAAGENCSTGGFNIETGIDTNRNSVLDSIEVQNSKYICNGEGPFFGKTQTGYIAGSIYHADSDGFLTVRYSSATGSGSINGIIYSDKTENPSTKVGMVNNVPGSTTVPIQKNNYWRVLPVTSTTVTISWIPILK